MQLLLADDHVIFRQRLKALLERSGIKVVGEASDGSEAVRLACELRPHIAILDFAMPLINGLAAGREIRRLSPRTRSILLTMHREHAYVLEAIQVGIRGYVVKTEAAAMLVQAVREVARGRIYLSPDISREVMDR